MSTDYASLTGDYDLDPVHTTIEFVARHAMITKVRGGFNDFSGTIHVDGTDPAKSSVQASLQIASIDTRNEQRNGHLLSGDFFEQDKYPAMSFASTGIAAKGENEFTLTGDLTVKDVTRSVEFEVEFTGASVDPYGNRRIGFEGEATLSRKDFGLTWNAALESGGVLVSDKVKVELAISAIKKI